MTDIDVVDDIKEFKGMIEEGVLDGGHVGKFNSKVSFLSTKALLIDLQGVVSRGMGIRKKKRRSGFDVAILGSDGSVDEMRSKEGEEGGRIGRDEREGSEEDAMVFGSGFEEMIGERIEVGKVFIFLKLAFDDLGRSEHGEGGNREEERGAGSKVDGDGRGTGENNKRIHVNKLIHQPALLILCETKETAILRPIDLVGLQ